MYKSLTKTDLEKKLGLPAGYKVNGFLSCGHYDVEEQLARFTRSLANINSLFKINKHLGFLQNVFEIKVNGLIYWFTTVYGGVMLSEYLHFACMFGSKRNIHIGSCGGLYPKMLSGDFLIPEWSYGNESSTRFYDRKNTKNIHTPNKEFGNKIKSKLAGEKTWEGPIMTCGAMLAETKDDVIRWSKDGYFGVEMETSTVFAVSNYFNVPSSALIFVADNLIKGQIVGDESYVHQRQMRYNKAQKMFDVATDVLLGN